MRTPSCLAALLRDMWCQTLVTLQAHQRYELRLCASTTGILYNKNTENIIPLYLKRFLHWTVVYLGTVQALRRFIIARYICLQTRLYQFAYPSILVEGVGVEPTHTVSSVLRRKKLAVCIYGTRGGIRTHTWSFIRTLV